MSRTDDAAQNGAPHAHHSRVPELDVSKLHALPTEQQDLFLLTFVSDLRHAVEALSADDLPPEQAVIKREVIKIAGLAAPVPSRIIRHTVAKTLADTFGRGSRSLLYETVNELLAILNAGKIDKDSSPKHGVVACLGELFASAGDSAVSLSGIVGQSLVKALKASHVGVRGSAFFSLSRLVEGLQASIDESLAREIWKAARSAASGDKSSFVQKNALRCLDVLATQTPYFNNSTDFENLKNTAWKTFDNPLPAVRFAVAKTLAAVLVGVYSDSSSSHDVPAIKRPKKSTKKQGALADDEEEIERPASPALPGSKPSVQLSLTLADIIRVLSTQFVKLTTTNRARAGIGSCYKLILRQLPQKAVEDNFGRICELLFLELVDHPSLLHYRHRFLLTRNIVARVLQSIVHSGIITENAHINAARYLINDILKNYPKVIAHHAEPSKRVLTAALDTLNLLMQQLGSAIAVLQDSCREALSQVMQHPSYTVQTYAALCFRTLVLACPSQLMPSIDLMLTRLRKLLDPGSETKQSSRTCHGPSLSIAAMLHSASQKPLFGSLAIYSKVFSYSTELLKSSATSELRLSATQVQVAWTLIGGLMNLGPSFVKVHLNQLLLLWRNAMPPPLTNENASQRSQLEFSFLCHVRECAMNGLLTFLTSCSSIITTDGSRRISAMLQNTVQFLNSLPASRQSEDMSHRLVPALQLQDMAVLLRRRVLQCYVGLAGVKHVDTIESLSHSDIMSLAISTFTSPDRPSDRRLETSLASSASNYDGLSEISDNWAFGVSGLMQGLGISYPSLQGFSTVRGPITCSEETDHSLDAITLMPALPAREHDPVTIYRLDSLGDESLLGPASTACVDAAIELFALVFPLQSARVQESIIEQLASLLSQPLQREPGKKDALHINVTLSILLALAVANDETPFPPGRIHFGPVNKTLGDILRQGIGHLDMGVRNAAARALGLACNLAGTSYTTSEVKTLIDSIVANRDPNMRAGCAVALGAIHLEVGAMASSLHIKSIVGVLLSLCNDPHPIVHFWALRGLMQVAESAGLSFSAYAASTLGMLAQLYSSDSHNEESSSVATSNLELELSTTAAIAQSVDCIINVLGPDLQDVSKLRNLILTLVQYFKSEDSVVLRYQAYLCLGHLSMYVPAHLQFSKYIQDLQLNLGSSDDLLSQVVVAGLNDQAKRNAAEVARVANSSLSDDLWLKIDQRADNTQLQSIMRNWMHQTVLVDPADWVDRCRAILSRTRAREPANSRSAVDKSAVPDLADEDVAGLTAAVAASQGEAAEVALEGQDYLRWQTRVFAMQLLSEALELIRDAMLPDQTIPAEEQLYSKIADIIRAAFTASTANVVELRIWGLRIIDQILKMFGKTPDPDFLEASLLEQYQAQIASALTPAFSADSSPELAAEAIAVCATFVATGIVTSAERMGRIFKVLANGLENLTKEEPEASVGDLKTLSPNAQAMLKMSLLSGWAELQLSSVEQPYLEDIVQPYVPKLAPLWLGALREFAGLRFEPEISDSLGLDMLTSNLDDRYASFNRVVRLQYYQGSWLSIVNAISVLVEKDSDSVFSALDGKSKQGENHVNGDDRSPGKDMSFREEPVAFFFILFGLAFEALVTRAREDPSQTLSILQALRKILTPAVSGNAVHEDVVFNETTDTLDRLALTSTSQTQSVLVEIARNLSIDHPSTKGDDERDGKLSDDIEQLFELTRIITLVLTGMIPTLEDPPSSTTRQLGPEAVALVVQSVSALVDVAKVFPDVIRADLQACIFHCSCSILATGICQEEVVPSILPVFRTFLQSAIREAKDNSTSATISRLVRGSLHQMLVVLSVAQRRDNDFSIVCAKNTLLSITILITSASVVIPPTDELVRKAVEEMLDCLQDVGLAKVAANCVRTLLNAKPKTGCDEAIARLLWPRLCAFICDTEAEDPETVRPILVAALVSSVATLPRQPAEAPIGPRPAAMAILIPLLLYRAGASHSNSKEEGPLRRESAERLLDLLTTDPAAFKSIVGLLNEADRLLLEELLRLVGGGRRSAHVDGGDEETEADQGGKKPAIELRMDF
ncbi:hypothetical protein DV735_g3637, partial [Chaetothyriales sp. CBS 134920]